MPPCPVGVLGGAGLETVSSVFWPVGTGGFPPIDRPYCESIWGTLGRCHGDDFRVTKGSHSNLLADPHDEFR